MHRFVASQVDSYRFWSWGYTQFWRGRSLLKEVGRKFDFETFHPTTNAATSCLRHVTDTKTQIFSFCTVDRKMGRSPCPFGQMTRLSRSLDPLECQSRRPHTSKHKGTTHLHPPRRDGVKPTTPSLSGLHHNKG